MTAAQVAAKQSVNQTANMSGGRLGRKCGGDKVANTSHARVQSSQTCQQVSNMSAARVESSRAIFHSSISILRNKQYFLKINEAEKLRL
jgi:hypothetical protein